MEVRGRRATVMGLGRHGGGMAVARWLAEQGAIVTVTDMAAPEALADSVQALADVEIAAWHLGGHRETDFEQAELIVVNPAVRPDQPLIERARARGATITSELELFLERAPGRLIGITGSNGKSTTAAMTAAILAADGRDVFLGGNIGRSLLGDLPRMMRDSWAVLEISSFQLAWLSPTCRLPEIAVLTNFTPNHLDWHGTLAEYAAAKRRLLGRTSPAKTVILGPDAAAAIGWQNAADDSAIRVVEPLSDAWIPPLRVPGEHNRANAACAAAVAQAIDGSAAAIDAALGSYAGLEHRLELVGTIAGREFYNDSMATTPESVAAALATFSGRAWLMSGGYDKKISLAPLIAAVGRHARGAACYGAVGPRLYAQLAEQFPSTRAQQTSTLAEAFAWCWQQSRPGECLILSPGCASYDQFADYRARGAHFRALVHALAHERARHDLAARDLSSP